MQKATSSPPTRATGVSFRTTRSKEALFGHYMIEVDWTETASVDSSSLTEYNLKEIASLPPLDWTLQSLTGESPRIEPVSPIPLIEPPPYYSSHHYSPGTGTKRGTGGEEETPPLELEPVSGSVRGWKLHCPATLSRCQTKAVLTAALANAAGGASRRG